MASASVDTAGRARTGNLLLACVAEHGTPTHAFFKSEALVAGHETARNLADAIHFLSALYGRHPGIVDHAATRTVEPAGRAWLASAAAAMAVERSYLTRLAVAAGPMPSTPGGAGSEAAILAQRAALATLAQSDRRGCALGAALAFAAEWASIRIVLDTAAKRLGVEPPLSLISNEEMLRDIADDAGQAPSTQRALLFGAQQLALQHRGLWDLLEARSQARREY
jgi:hypothetical protein